jgi:hypothetical protein
MMKSEFLWLVFVVGAVLSWGAYVPVLHQGQTALGEGKPVNGAIRAFMCVGIAYCITAILVPLALMISGAEVEEFQKFQLGNVRGFSFAILGGIAGAAGALCIVMSLKYGGSPLFVAPLVFAGAPIVNAGVGLLWHPPKFMPGPLFYAGLVLAAVGAGLVLYSKADLDKRSREVSQAAVSAEAAPPPVVAQITP